MDKALLVLGAVAVAGAISALLSRRGSTPGAAPTHHIPVEIDRADFHGAELEWLIVVFSSATCETCSAVVSNIGGLSGSQVETQDVELTQDAALHDRYRIEAVPTTLIADAAGTVRKSFLGPVTQDDLEQALRSAMAPAESGEI